MVESSKLEAVVETARELSKAWAEACSRAGVSMHGGWPQNLHRRDLFIISRLHDQLHAQLAAIAREIEGASRENPKGAK